MRDYDHRLEEMLEFLLDLAGLVKLRFFFHVTDLAAFSIKLDTSLVIILALFDLSPSRYSRLSEEITFSMESRTSNQKAVSSRMSSQIH